MKKSNLTFNLSITVLGSIIACSSFGLTPKATKINLLQKNINNLPKIANNSEVVHPDFTGVWRGNCKHETNNENDNTPGSYLSTLDISQYNWGSVSLYIEESNYDGSNNYAIMAPSLKTENQSWNTIENDSLGALTMVNYTDSNWNSDGQKLVHKEYGKFRSSSKDWNSDSDYKDIITIEIVNGQLVVTETHTSVFTSPGPDFGMHASTTCTYDKLYDNKPEDDTKSDELKR